MFLQISSDFETLWVKHHYNKPRKLLLLFFYDKTELIENYSF